MPLSDDQEKEFRRVNQILGTQPSLGPFPAEQILPWTVIALASYFVVNGFFGGLFEDDFDRWLWTVLMAGWGIASWWLLTGGRSWRFLSKFIGVPTWTRGFARYQSLLLKIDHEAKNRQTKRRRRGRQSN